MLITKKQSKNLRYFARANYKADVKGTVAEDGSKVKHREYPVFGLCYDEKKADNSMVELTNIMVLYKPFTGTTFEELMEALNNVLGSDEVCEKQAEKVEPSQQEQDTCDCLLAGPNCVQTPIPPGPPIAQPIAEPQEEPEHLFGPKSHRGVVGDALNFFKNVKLVDREPQAAEKPLGVLDPIPSGLIKNEAECLEALAPSYENYPPKEPASVADIPEEVKESVLETAETVTTLVHPEMQVVSKEIKDLSEDGTLTVDVKAVANNPVDHIDVQIKAKPAEPETVDAAESVEFLKDHDTVLEVKPAAPQELPVVEDVEEAKQVVEETGKPVITAEQAPNVHLAAAADGSHDETAVFVPEEHKPKKLTRAELYDLQMKCGVMRLATLYGEDPDTKLDVLMKLYPDAATRLNEVYAADGIKTYTITEEAIQKAYPDEYAALRK